MKTMSMMLPSWLRKKASRTHNPVWEREVARLPPSARKAAVRHYEAWLKSQGGSPLDDETPWITFDAIDFLRSYLRKNMRVFEYGSGGSSVFFARRSKHVVTIEHDPKWLAAVQARISNAGLGQAWTGQHVAMQPGAMGSGDNSDPDDYTSDDFANANFFGYASAIDRFPDRSFDIVVVDGRARPSCLKHAAPKVAAEGLLLLDNSDREYYLRQAKRLLASNFNILLSRPGPSPYGANFTQTTIWRRRA